MCCARDDLLIITILVPAEMPPDHYDIFHLSISTLTRFHFAGSFIMSGWSLIRTRSDVSVLPLHVSSPCLPFSPIINSQLSTPYSDARMIAWPVFPGAPQTELAKRADVRS